MRRQPHWRRIAIPTGIATSILLAAAWVWSGWRCAVWRWTTNSRSTSVWLLKSQFGLQCFTDPSIDYRPWPGTFRQEREYVRGSPPPPLWSTGFTTDWPLRGPIIFIPLWCPFLIVALPTSYLVYRARRTPSGHCRTCRYDLTGITTGTCPECGTSVSSAAPSTPS